MMWWFADGSGAYGWWWLGIVFMFVCFVLMGRMMSHGRTGGHHGDSHQLEVPERILANRLASGEISIDEYERVLEALHRPVGSTGL
jgi:uncharacterized membrane protein